MRGRGLYFSLLPVALFSRAGGCMSKRRKKEIFKLDLGRKHHFEDFHGIEIRLGAECWGGREPLWEEGHVLVFFWVYNEAAPANKFLVHFGGRLEGTKRISPAPRVRLFGFHSIGSA